MERKSAERLAELIETVEPLPQVATLVVEKCADPKASTREIASCLSNDPAFTAKVLSVANSVFYRGEKEIKTAQEAVMRIGQKALKNIVYSTAVYSLFAKDKKKSGFDREAFWLHSLSVAVCARLLAERHRMEEGEAFTAGLLHDIGKVLIDQASTEKAGKGNASKLETVLMADDEAMIEGLDPAEVGYHAGRKWNLPAGIVKAIGYIRVEDLEFIGNKAEEALVRVIQGANAFCEDVESLKGNPHPEILETYGARFDLEGEEMSAFAVKIRDEVGATAELFNLKKPDVQRYFDALAVAQSEIDRSKLEQTS